MLIALIAIAAVLLLLAALLFLPLKLILTAKESVRLDARIGFWRVPLYPQKKKKRKRKKKIYTDKKKVTGIARIDKKIEQLSLRDELRLVRALLQTVVRRRKKWLRLHAARLHVRVATGDAASTATLYGTVSAGIGALLATLDHLLDLDPKTKHMSVLADFLSEKPSFDLKFVFSTPLLRALVLLLPIVLDAMKAQKERENAEEEREEEKPAEEVNTPSPTTEPHTQATV